MTQQGSKSFTVGLQIVLSDCEPLVSRLLAKRRIPTTASVCRLREKHLQCVQTLHLANFPVPDFEVCKRLHGKSSQVNYSLALSTALELDGRLLGFTASYPLSEHDDTVFMYGIVVREANRLTWATPYLKYQTAKHLMSEGYKTLCFQADAHGSDGVNYASRLGI